MDCRRDRHTDGPATQHDWSLVTKGPKAIVGALRRDLASGKGVEDFLEGRILCLKG